MTAHDTIENLWDRATPVAPLLMTHKAEVTEANAAWLDTVGEPEAAHLLRAIAADLRFAIAHPAASAPTGAPLSASPASSVSESAQSPAGAPEGRLGDLPSTEDLAAADNPTHLRWGLNDVLWSDDDSVIVMFSGPDREPYWLELDPERAAVLHEDLAGPDGESTTPPRQTLTPNEYDSAWHAVEGAAGEVGADPGTILHAVLDRLGIQWQDAAQPTATSTPAR